MRATGSALTAASVMTAAAVAGSLSGPTPNNPVTAAWYAHLRKPSFTPPGPVFGAAWGVLDVLLGYAGYRLLRSRRRPARSVAIGAWGLTVSGVAGFSWVLFGRKRPDEALGVNAAMVGASVALVGAAARVDRTAAGAALPVALWIGFAFVLQEEVWRRNR